MSSLAGIFYFDGRPVPPETERGLFGALSPHDTDDFGEHRSPGFFLAHAATWFDELSPLEHQPLRSPTRVLAFDGRLDNRDDLLLRLRRQINGPPTDAALVLAALETWHDEAFVQLVGDWSLALWQPDARTLTLASDYAGIRPLYYYADASRIVWSSHLKPLVALAGEPDIDDQFVAGFFTGTKAPHRTPYRNILPVPPGYWVRAIDGTIATHAFWSLPTANRIRYADERDYDAHLRTLFRESVRARLRSSHPVCAELSGGHDSSSIVCLAHELMTAREAEAPVLCPISFASRRTNDGPFYQKVRQWCGFDEGLEVDIDAFPFLDLNYFDEASPVAWGARLNELARIAHDAKARVYLTGMGGDLMMGQLVNDCEQLATALRRGNLKRFFYEALAWSKASQHPLFSILSRGAVATLPPRWLAGYRYGPLSSGRAKLAEKYGDSLTPSFREKTGIDDCDWLFSTRWHQAAPERRKFAHSLTHVLETGSLFRPPERLQHLYYSHPFAHRPLVEFLLAIPADIVVGPSEPRRLMRRAFRDFLPPEIAARRSKGQYTGVFLETLRPQARALVQEKTLHVVARGWVDEKEVRERLDRMTHSLDCNEPQLRQVILLELWFRRRERRGVSEPDSSVKGWRHAPPPRAEPARTAR